MTIKEMLAAGLDLTEAVYTYYDKKIKSTFYPANKGCSLT